MKTVEQIIKLPSTTGKDIYLYLWNDGTVTWETPRVKEK